MAYMTYNWDLVSNLCFVFGSNLAGYHGAGAAYYAHQSLGAAWGAGTGRTGRCYAIPTKDGNMQTLSLDKIENFVYRFISMLRLAPVSCLLSHQLVVVWLAIIERTSCSLS